MSDNVRDFFAAVLVGLAAGVILGWGTGLQGPLW